MRIVFMGSPKEAIHPLAFLLKCQADLQVVAVVSQPARPQGRKRRLQDPPVAEYAKANDLQILQPEKARDPEFLEQLRRLKPDVIVTAAYGQILSEDFLSIPSRATINIHPSMLPKYRGAIPVPACLLDGCEKTGVSILFTVKALDAGNLILQKEFSIRPHEQADALLDRLFHESGPMLSEALLKLKDPNFVGTPQDESKVSHCKKIEKTSGLVDWSRSCADIYNTFRAFQPWPGVFSLLNGQRVVLSGLEPDSGDQKTHRQLDQQRLGHNPGHLFFESGKLFATCGDGLLELKKLKPAGKQEQDGQSFWNGLKSKQNFSEPVRFDQKIPRLAVGISGGGRTLKNLLQYANEKKTFEIAWVFASRQCAGLAYAEAAGCPHDILDFKESVTAYFQDRLAKLDVDLVVLAGFIKKFPTLDGWQDKVLNIHPSLLPKHGGKGMFGSNVHNSVLAAGDTESGATVHLVNDEYDQGQIVSQATVDISQCTNAEEIAGKVFEVECKLYPAAVEKVLEKQKSEH